MKFDLNPTESVDDLYDRKKELGQLEGALKRRERLIVVYGLRRVGKTSLIRAMLNEKEFPYIFIDLKEIYYEHTSVPLSALAEAMAEEFVKFASGLGLDPENFSGGLIDNSITSLLKGINEWCKGKGVFFVIALDEAQYLRYAGRVRYDGIIAWSVDNLSNIAYVLTGSEIGMLRDFLRYEDANAPLYGRFRDEIYLDRFGRKESTGFLSAGFKKSGVKATEAEIEDAVESIGGIVGWLAYYGYYRCALGLDHKEAVAKVFEEGSRILANEVGRLIARSRRRYIYVLKAIANGIDRWSEIKPYVSAKGERVSDTILSSLLRNLVKLGLVEKVGETYAINDPIEARMIKKLKP